MVMIEIKTINLVIQTISIEIKIILLNIIIIKVKVIKVVLTNNSNKEVMEIEIIINGIIIKEIDIKIIITNKEIIKVYQEIKIKDIHQVENLINNHLETITK